MDKKLKYEPDSRQIVHPRIGLDKAIAIAASVHKAVKGSRFPRSVVFDCAGYRAPSGSAIATISSLRHFGLISLSDNGMSTITALASSILDPEGEKKMIDGAILAALNRPEPYRELLRKFPFEEGLPDRHEVELVVNSQRKMSPRSVAIAARAFVASWRYYSTWLEREQPDLFIADERRSYMAQRQPSSRRREYPVSGSKRAQIKSGRAIAPQSESVLRGFLSGGRQFRLRIDGTMGARDLDQVIKVLETQKSLLEEGG